MIEQGVAARLLQDAGVQNLAGRRVYPTRLPEGEEVVPGAPSLEQERTFSGRMRTLQGPSGLVHADVQLNAIGATYDDAKSLAEAARLALVGTRTDPAPFPATWGPWRVQAAMADDDADDFVPPASGEEGGTYLTSFTLAVWYEDQ